MIEPEGQDQALIEELLRFGIEGFDRVMVFAQPLPKRSCRFGMSGRRSKRK